MCVCRTEFSGIRPEDIEKGDNFEKVKKEVVEIVRNKIVVGHSIEYDLASLKINPEGTVYIHPILKIKEIVFINKKKTL